MNKKLIWTIILVIILALVLFLVKLKIQGNENAISNTPIKIGVAVGLTGYGANWGQGEAKAVQLALKKYEDQISRPIELIIEDTKSDGLGTVNAVRKLVDTNKVQAIIGPTWGDSFQGGYPIAEIAKVVVISPSSAMETIENKDQFKYLYSTWWPQEQEAKTLVDHMNSAGINQVALVHDNDAFNTKFGDIFTTVSQMNRKSSFINSRTIVPIGTTDFRTHITKIKSSKPAAILVLLQDTSSVGTFMKQLKDQGLNVKIYSTTSAENEENIQKFPGYFEGLVYSFPAYEGEKSYSDLKNKFVENFGESVSQGPSFVNAYNAGLMLFESIKNSLEKGTDIKTEVDRVSVPGIGSSNLSFDKNGQLSDTSFIIKTVKGDKFIRIQ